MPKIVKSRRSDEINAFLKKELEFENIASLARKFGIGYSKMYFCMTGRSPWTLNDEIKILGTNKE